MATQKPLVLSVDQDRITLPKELIPDNVSLFGYELQDDGRIILTPLGATADETPDSLKIKTPVVEKKMGTKVIDFQAAQSLRNKRVQKNKNPSNTIKSPVSLGKNTAFVKLHLFASRLEAEMAGEILNQSEIPYLIQSEDIGLFGPGAAPAPGGAGITVRKSDLEFSRDLLSGLI